MKNIGIKLACAALVAVAGMAAYAASVSKVSPEQRARNLARLHKLTGGFIRRIDALPGQVVFLNSQSTVATDKLKDSVTTFGKTLRIPVKIAKHKAMTMADALKGMPKNGEAIAVLILDDSGWDVPMFVAPEKGWAVVNVAPLKKDAKSEAFIKSRLEKELVRAALYVCGGANSQYENSLMKPIKEAKDLDVLMNSGAPMDVVGRTYNYLPSFGISPNPYVTYLTACKQGWAPAPTNEVQKAIWDKVHAMPTAPIKIKPETKKVKE